MFKVRKSDQIFALGLCFSLLAGCSSTIYKKDTVGDLSTLSVDSKQRFLTSLNAPNAKFGEVVCAEPSPDALVAQSFALSSALSAAQSANKNVKAELAASLTEAATTIGNRTAAIQVLRDGYFRLCEAFMNGAIKDKEYVNVLDHVDGVIAVVMAIDALSATASTRVVLQPGTATAGTNAKSGTTVTTGGTPQNQVVTVKVEGQAEAEQQRVRAIHAVVKQYLDYRKHRMAFEANERRKG